MINARERIFRVVLRLAGPGDVAVLGELDSKAIAPEQVIRLEKDFVFSYDDFLSAYLGASRHNSGTEVPKIEEAALARLGDAVGRVVFPGPVATALASLLDEARAGNEAVLLTFETAEPELLSIPFEAARLADGRPLVLEPGVRLLRRHLGVVARAIKPLPGPLRILVAIGAPDEERNRNAVLDIEAELQIILDAVDVARWYGNAEVKILEVANPEQIRLALLEESYHVLHLSSHGAAGMIRMETEDGEGLDMAPEDLTNAIRSAAEPPPLVVLASSQSATSRNNTASFAQGLLEQGIPMVIAMQGAISDWYATRFAGAFYGYLTRRDVRLPSHALALARQDVERRRREELRQGQEGVPSIPEYATPSLFCAGNETPLLDWDTDRINAKRHSPRPVTGPVPILNVGDLVGRRKEIRELLCILLDDPRAVAKWGRKAGAIVHGIGGVGKSVLAGRAMSRLAERGWRLVAVEGRWTLGELATQVGAVLIADEDESIQRLAGPLIQPTLPDEVRLQLLAQLLAGYPILLVLDNFEDNLTLAGTAFLDASTVVVLEALFRSCHRGKILVTSRYPIPNSEPWLVPLLLGPLSPAQTRKLLYRLTELKDQPPVVLGKILRLIGGHPRVLEYLDAILHKGTGRLSIVEERLRENVYRLGLKVEDLGGDLEQSLQDAIRIGAQDIFLDELLDMIVEDPTDREILGQASVFPMPIDLHGLAFALSNAQEPDTERIGVVREAVARLVRTSLLIPLEDDSVWVHRWTAEALKERIGPVHLEYCRRAGEFFFWRVRTASHSLIDAIEGVRLFLQAGAFDRATAEAEAIYEFMSTYSQTVAIAAFLGELLEALPESHRDYPLYLGREVDSLWILGATSKAIEKAKKVSELLKQGGDGRNLAVSYNKSGDLLRALGQGEEAKALYATSLRIVERLAADEPNRADFQRDLSVSYYKLGDLLSALGQSEQAKTFYEKSLRIIERLAADEPNRADYQRDLSVSYNKLGDLLRAIGQGEQAKTFYEKSLRIRELLAAAEPNRADYQRDLSVSYNKLGDLLRAIGQGEQAKTFYEKSLRIIERLAADEPNRTDYQRDLSVSYNKLGDLLRAIGQGEQAKTFYEKSLRIIERLAAAEPNRADYQRDLSVSYNKLGDLLRAIGQGEQAKTFYEMDLRIAERLAADEPNRADYQTDLVVSLVRLAPFDPENGKVRLRRALSILESLKNRGTLLPMFESWRDTVRQMLAALDGSEET